VSKTFKTAFPRWVVFTIIASCLALVVLGVLAAQMIVRERAIHRHQMQRMSLAPPQADQPQNPSVESRIDDSSAQEASDLVRRWEGVLAQVKHPYNRAQVSVLEEEWSGDSLDSSRDRDWTVATVGLAKFTLTNRRFLDSIYEMASKPIKDSLWVANLERRGLYQVRELVFWDAANSVLSKDKERLAKSLEAYLRLRQYTESLGVATSADWVSLLHRALDEGLVNPKESIAILERLAAPTTIVRLASDPFGGSVESRRANYYATFDRQFEDLWMIPSVKEKMFDEYYFRNNVGSNAVVDVEQYFVLALKYFTFAVRVALLESIEESHGQSVAPNDVLSRLRMPSEFDRVLSAKLGENYSLLSFFDYQEKSAGIGELTFKLPRDISTGAFPVRTGYEIRSSGAPN